MDWGHVHSRHSFHSLLEKSVRIDSSKWCLLKVSIDDDITQCFCPKHFLVMVENTVYLALDRNAILPILLKM